MTVALEPVDAARRPVLENLLGLYLYDLSGFVDAPPGPDGRYVYGSTDRYFGEPGRDPYFLTVGGALGGFVLVGAQTETGAAHGIAEFFVLRRLRRKGVGIAAAAATFARYPGTWEVCTDVENEPAPPFWRRAVDAFTAGRFEVRDGINGWTGPMYLFESR